MDQGEKKTPISSVISEIVANNDPLQNKQSTPLRNTRTHRIFRDKSQSNLSPVSPLQKLPINTERTINTSRIRSISPQGCQIYYKQGYANPRLPITAFQQNLSPVKLQLVKSTQILQYQNNLLRKQLQQRDDIILMYKRGWTPNSLPLNDNIIKSLNLKLAQKNVLIEQIHRNLIEFQQYVAKQKIQISAVCAQRLKILLQLVIGHEHYPILIRQRVIETSRAAQKVFIHQNTNINTHEWQIKMQKSYAELTTIKQKLQWFEKQNKILQSTIEGLKVHKSGDTQEDVQFYKVQIQKLTNQILILQQQTGSYRFQIKNLTQSIQQLRRQLDKNSHSINQQLQITMQLQIQRLRNNINSLQTQLSAKKAEILLIKQNLSRTNERLQISQQNYNNINQQNIQLKYQIEQLKIKLSDLQNKNITKIVFQQQNNKLKLHIKQLQQQLRKINEINKQLQKQQTIYQQNTNKWKKHCQDAQNYIQKLLKDIQLLNTQITKSKTQNYDYNKLTIQNNRLATQISQLLENIQKLRIQCQTLNKQNCLYTPQIQQYKQQISQFSIKIQTLTIQHKKQIQDIINRNKKQFMIKQRQIQTNLRKYWEQNVNNLQIQINRLTLIINQNQKDRNTGNIDIIRRQYQQIIKTLNIKIQQFDINKKQQINLIKLQYQQKINKLIKDIDSLRYQITQYKSQKSIQQWQKQIQTIHKQYKYKIQIIQQNYITKQQQNLTIINSLKSNICSLQNQNTQLKLKLKLNQNNQTNQFYYKIDTKYKQIQQKIILLKNNNSQSIIKQIQILNKLKDTRKQDIQNMQILYKQILMIIGNIQQVIIVKRNQLYRLDFNKFDNFIEQITKIKQNKVSLQTKVRQQLENKFYILLKQISTNLIQ